MFTGEIKIAILKKNNQPVTVPFNYCYPARDSDGWLYKRLVIDGPFHPVKIKWLGLSNIAMSYFSMVLGRPIRVRAKHVRTTTTAEEVGSVCLIHLIEQ